MMDNQDVSHHTSHTASHLSTHTFSSIETPADQDKTSKDGESSSIITTATGNSAGITNFLGVSENAGMDNFLGVGETTVNFLGVGDGSNSGQDMFNGVGENGNADPNIDQFFHAEEEENVCQESDNAFDATKSMFSDLDSLVRTGTDYYSNHRSFEDTTKNIYTNLDDTNTFSGTDTLTVTGNNAHSEGNNFLGIRQGASLSHGLENFLGAAEKRLESEQDKKPWLEVKIEIDIADSVFVESTNFKTNSGGENVASPKSDHSHSQGEDSLELCHGTEELTARKLLSFSPLERSHRSSKSAAVSHSSFSSCSDLKSCKLGSFGVQPHKMEASRSEHFTETDQMHNGEGVQALHSKHFKNFDQVSHKITKSGPASHNLHGFQTSRGKRATNSSDLICQSLAELEPWQVKLEPDWENSSEGSSEAANDKEAEGGSSSQEGGRNCRGGGNSGVVDSWSPFYSPGGGLVHFEDIEEGGSQTNTTPSNTTPTPVTAPDSSILVPSHHIKQEPVMLATNHITHIVSGINKERLQSSGKSVLSTEDLAAESSLDSYNPDFVIKMEPESDQETVINGTSNRSRDDSSSATEEEESYSLMKQQVKVTVSQKKKSPNCPDAKLRPYRCQYCDSAFAKKCRLVEHTRIHTDERPYSCDQCNISFRKAESLRVHMRTHTGELPFQCQDCDSAFKCSQELKRHTIRKHLAIRPFSCTECEARFFSKADLKGHSRLHSGEKPYKCPDCHSAFRKSSALTCHMRIHTGQKPYSCLECERLFRRSDQLKRHMKMHTGERPHKCDTCGAAFSGLSDLKKHTARKHSLTKPFSCPVCGNKFYTSEDLKMHRVFHMGIKPHVCSECGASFVRASDLKVHMRIHTGEKPFSCNLCTATFARSGDLKLHLRMHDDKRPFTCSVCNLSFRRSGHLTRHMNTHNGRKSFSCEDCDAAFFTSSDLKRHAARVHKKDVSKFACLECEARFFTSRALNIHRMKHTRDGAYPCSVCSAAFAHSDLLMAHVESAHEGVKKVKREGGKKSQSVVTESETNDSESMYVSDSVICAEQLDINSESISEEVPLPAPVTFEF